MKESNAVSILVVDDDEVDAIAIKRAFRRCESGLHVDYATSAEEALKLLREGEDSAKQHLVLLDLNMPGLGGLGFLEERAGNRELENASLVFVVSSSEHPSDIERAYQLKATGYIVKSKAGDNYEHLIELISKFIDCVEFPRDRKPFPR